MNNTTKKQLQNTIYIETMGCQMNKLDSELIESQLASMGFDFTDDPEQAGTIIYNTCSVRHHAEEKVISKVGQLRKRHKEKGDLILAVVGCMAQRLGSDLQREHKHVDIVCGPGQLHRLGELITQTQREHKHNILLNDQNAIDDLETLDSSRHQIETKTPFMSFVRVMRGCNNYCSYCIVPYVRGPEQSRPLDHIVTESQRLVDNGVKEITLLGQTVNSYKYKNGDKTLGLADVLEAVHEIDGLKRLRFVTNYPRNFDERILHAMAQLPKVCEYLHIPAQSGSDRILKAMNRNYTADEYIALMDRARETVPNITIAGDFIVGFCNEKEEDFEASKELIRKVRYKNCFIFKYSPRPGTKSDKRLIDNVPEVIKKRRNTELLAVQNEISLEDNQQFVGQTVKILVEGPSKKPHLNNSAAETTEKLQLVGRTPGDHIVVFNGNKNMIGEIVRVKINRASALTLFANEPQTS